MSDIYPDDSGYHHLVYETTNLINGKRYVGIHSTKDPDDGYIGTGTIFMRSVKKYGRDNFERTILSSWPTRNEAKLEEARIVDEEWTADPMTYNLCTGGNGRDWTEEQRELHGRFISSQWTEERRRKTSEETRKRFKGKKKSPEHHAKMSDIRKNVPKKTCEWCHQEFDPTPYAMWHGEYCKLNPDRKIRPPRKYPKDKTCERCGKVCRSQVYSAFHGPKCRQYLKKKRMGKKERYEHHSRMMSGEGNPCYGKKFTEEWIERMSASARNIKKVRCIHCGNDYAPGMHKRWHGDNCKQSPVDPR